MGKGYVYAGYQLLAVQQNGVYFVHEDPITKSKRVTDIYGTTQSAVELDPYGADAGVYNTAFQPRKFTSYERDPNGTDEAMARRYNRWHSRFDQPDPYEGSYDFTNPQSFNRYAYTKGDPVNLADPTGLVELTPCYMSPGCRYHGFDDGWEPYNADDRGFPGHHIPRDNNGGGGIEHGDPSQTSTGIDFLSRLKDCVHTIYGVELTDFSAVTNENKLGSFLGSGYNRYTGITGLIQVLTNASAYSSDRLKAMNNEYARNYPEKGQPLVRPGERALGATFSFGTIGLINVTPYVNYLANNPPSFNSPDGALLLLQVHELGHSLADITGKGKGERGKQLEDCVFPKLPKLPPRRGRR